MPRYRVLLYILIGVCFGILDWHIPNITIFLFPQTAWGHPMVSILSLLWIYQLWLVPAIPVAIYETQTSLKLWKAGTAVVITWLCGLAGYYLYYAYLLAFVGLNQMEHLLLSAPHDALFWQDWRNTFQSLLLGQWLEWTPIAVVGRGSVGVTTGWLYQRLWQHGQQHTIAPTRTERLS